MNVAGITQKPIRTKESSDDRTIESAIKIVHSNFRIKTVTAIRIGVDLEDVAIWVVGIIDDIAKSIIFILDEFGSRLVNDADDVPLYIL
ncbi:MAG: hypothetical protein A2Y16_05270 [Tenericutes bacterium GWF2_57_13]|nr:MAG: hypothetical protein A2Y16_05270 [Tenericutes bacterium GWF2_57_13]